TGPAQLYDGTRIWWAGERRSPPLEAPSAEEPHALLPERMLGSWRRIGAGVGRAGTIACGRRWLAVESPIERRFTIWTPGRSGTPHPPCLRGQQAHAVWPPFTPPSRRAGARGSIPIAWRPDRARLPARRAAATTERRRPRSPSRRAPARGSGPPS